MKMRKRLVWIFPLLLATTLVNAQSGITNTANSNYARLNAVNMGDVQFTKGFWAERFAVCRDSMVPRLWKTYTDAQLCHSFKNFEIAAGLDTGKFKGPSFHDGDFYKTLEAMAGMYAATHDPQLDRWMDTAIAVIAKAQLPDGYIYTKSIIEQKKTGATRMFDDKLSFEAYNFGHLMTAACVHYRATGKTTLLDIARKATDFLEKFYATATPEQARNAICPSHYMGIIEMYRTLHDPAYLQLAKKLIDIRGTVEGTDDNSDREPFREMDHVAGHAVRANYLFAGVADVYAETGDTTLLDALDKLWDDVVNRKMYVTGGCGALYDGISVDGISYKPDTVQRIHQAYGRDYQLPNLTAHNETCANIGNVLWNWRMLQLTGEARYADVVELALYNSVLSGVSLDGTSFFYTNPLAEDQSFPYHLRWEGGRQPYIKLSNCCPPNTVRTIAEVADYMYDLSRDGLFINLYSGNSLRTKLESGEMISVRQQTDYPWKGAIDLAVDEAPTSSFAIHLRIPGWCKKATWSLNGKMMVVNFQDLDKGYLVINRKWKKGDHIQLNLDMPVTLVESNPLVEETNGRVTVKRGPVVYCLESADLATGVKVRDIVLQLGQAFKPVPMTIGNSHFMSLQGQATRLVNNNWGNTLYREINTSTAPVQLKLIPYYAWANRGQTDMSVWLPLAR